MAPRLPALPLNSKCAGSSWTTGSRLDNGQCAAADTNISLRASLQLAHSRRRRPSVETDTSEHDNPARNNVKPLGPAVI